MQQNHMTDRMMQIFFPATPGHTWFFSISLVDNSTQSNKCSTGQKYMYIISPPCPDCFVQILPLRNTLNAQ